MALTIRSRFERTLHFSLPVLLAWLFLLPVCFDRVFDSDTGWHLAQGRLISASGMFYRNMLAWTAIDHAWYPSSWLYDLCLYRLTLAWGVFGAQFLTFAASAITVALIAIACREVNRLGAWVAPMATLLILPRITPRPHVAVWIMLAAVLALGLAGQQRGWKYRLACLPVLALGSNIHEGVIFAAGVCVLFCLEAFWRDRRWRELAVAAGAVAALTLNPGGLFILTDTTRHLWLAQMIKLEEYEQPTFRRATAFFLLIPIALIVAFLDRRRRPVLLPLTIIFAILGCYAVRMIYEFEIITAATVAVGLAMIGQRWGVRAQAISIALLLTGLLAYRTRRLTEREWSPSFNEHMLPVRAARFLEHERIDGRAYNTYNDGGFLEYAVPGFQAFQDGRVHAFPDDFFALELDAEKSPESFRAYLKQKDVEYAVTSHFKGKLTGHALVGGTAWALVYWDDKSEIYLRRDVPRYADVIARDEYRFVTPEGLSLATVKAAGWHELVTMRREVDRYEGDLDQPDPLSALVRCGVDVRLKEPTAAASCSLAEQLAPPQARTLLGEIQQFAPAVPE